MRIKSPELELGYNNGRNYNSRSEVVWFCCPVMMRLCPSLWGFYKPIKVHVSSHYTRKAHKIQVRFRGRFNYEGCCPKRVWTCDFRRHGTKNFHCIEDAPMQRLAKAARIDGWLPPEIGIGRPPIFKTLYVWVTDETGRTLTPKTKALP